MSVISALLFQITGYRFSACVDVSKCVYRAVNILSLNSYFLFSFQIDVIHLHVCAHLPCYSSVCGFIGAAVSLMYSIQVVHYCTHVSDVCVLHGSVNLSSVSLLFFPHDNSESYFSEAYTQTYARTVKLCVNNVSVSFFWVNQEAEQSDNFVLCTQQFHPHTRFCDLD